MKHTGLIIIILLSLLFRVSFLSAVEFKTDEAVALFLATRSQFGHPFPPGSTVSSFGILNPPFFLYLLYPFTLVSLDPKIISAGIGLINALAVGLYYILLKKYYGKITAIFASVLLAVSPWAVLFSRKIWAQDFIFPLTVFLLFCLHKIIVEKKTTYWIGYCFVALLLLQLHQAALFFIIPLTVFLFLQRPRFNFRSMILGCCLGILPLIPFMIFEIQHGFITSRGILHATQQVSTQHHSSVFFRPLQIMSQGNFFFIFGNDIIAFAQRYSWIYHARIVFYLEYVLVPFGMLLFFRKNPKMRFLLYPVILLSVIYFVLRITPEMHYFIILLPFLFLFLGTTFSFFFGKTHLFKIGTIMVYFLLVAVSIGYTFSFFRFISEKGHLSGDYGTIIGVNQGFTRAAYAAYKDTPEYDEMVVASYIPRNYMRGTTIVTKMLYDFRDTEKNLALLDERIRTIPEDIRVHHELLAYYTRTVPTEETLALLRKKSNTIPAYATIYFQAYEEYLTAHLRRPYQSRQGFAFEYPQHWHAEDETKGQYPVVKGEGLVFSFVPADGAIVPFPATGTQQEETVEVLTQEIAGITCISEEQQWCGARYGPIPIGETHLLLTVTYDNELDSKSYRKTDPKEIKDLSNILLSTLRIVE
ncbi:glycosyltransferase family 39 protein [Candidatus Roizmanbacteria bacterium]|nr:glycosyltransferase family 39 protein [Candidatus Roizmanbacteria bacterium]